MVYRVTERRLQRDSALRERILQLGLRRVAEGGFAALTMQALADDAGIATGSLYRHFRGEVADVDGVLHGQRGDRRGGVAALGEQGFDVGLQSGATTGVVTGQAEHYGAGSRCFHGA